MITIDTMLGTRTTGVLPGEHQQIGNHHEFQIENITVARAPLLKIFYWECCDIEGLNKKFKLDWNVQEHSMHMPTRQINSKPLKVVFWLRNTSSETIELNLRRIKNCQCQPMETRVGFNQFRKLYHCPHRRLIHILQEKMVLQPNDLVAMSAVFYFFLYGDQLLTYELSCSDSRVFILNFLLDIVAFDPQKCVLSKELIPTDMREYRRFVQPIWIRNITMQSLNFTFTARNRGMRFINPSLSVPRQSIWPLMVEYRPSDYQNQLDFQLIFDSVKTKFSISALGIMDTEPPELNVPIEDYDCVDYPYVIYPNKLVFVCEQQEQRSLMVCVHNYSQKCVEFRWQNYIINDLFEVTFEPSRFTLKSRHSKLCVVNLRVFERPLYFKRIPLVLEVHRIFDRATKIAKELLEEIESIDDPKWKQDSYMEHVFLELNIKVNFPKEPTVEIDRDLIMSEKVRRSRPRTTTVFEHLFWDYLSQSDHMRGGMREEYREGLSYDEVISAHRKPPVLAKCEQIKKNEVLKLISQLMAEAVRELGKNWFFVPPDYCN